MLQIPPKRHKIPLKIRSENECIQYRPASQVQLLKVRVFSTSPSFNTHWSTNKGRLTCDRWAVSTTQIQSVHSWHRCSPSPVVVCFPAAVALGSCLTFCPPIPTDRALYSESPSFQLKEHRPCKCSKKRQYTCESLKCLSQITVGLSFRCCRKSWMSTTLLKEVNQEVLVLCLRHCASLFRRKAMEARSLFTLSWRWLTRWATSDLLHWCLMLMVETVFG